jgi:hypothetical protein
MRGHRVIDGEISFDPLWSGQDVSLDIRRGACLSVLYEWGRAQAALTERRYH